MSEYDRIGLTYATTRAPDPRIERQIAEALGGAEIFPVGIAHDCSDGFLCAWWRRPLAYLDESVRANISSFAALEPDVLGGALERLERDVADGTWAERNADLIARDEADFGYRLLVAS